MDEIADDDPPGWYGKLSTVGDFVSRRLSPEFIRFVDDWLSLGMSAGREQLGEQWLEVYLNAPVLQFAWAPGVYDAQWWFGVLMPSCDNVGRYFPLLIVQARAQPPHDTAGLQRLEGWLEHLATAALQTLQDHASIEALEAELNEAAAEARNGTVAIRGGAGISALAAQLQGLAADSLATRLGGCSLWHSRSSAPGLQINQGLPAASAFPRLLAGD